MTFSTLLCFLHSIVRKPQMAHDMDTNDPFGHKWPMTWTQVTHMDTNGPRHTHKWPRWTQMTQMDTNEPWHGHNWPMIWIQMTHTNTNSPCYCHKWPLTWTQMTHDIDKWPMTWTNDSWHGQVQQEDYKQMHAWWKGHQGPQRERPSRLGGWQNKACMV